MGHGSPIQPGGFEPSRRSEDHVAGERVVEAGVSDVVQFRGEQMAGTRDVGFPGSLGLRLEGPRPGRRHFGVLPPRARFRGRFREVQGALRLPKRDEIGSIEIGAITRGERTAARQNGSKHVHPLVTMARTRIRTIPRRPARVGLEANIASNIRCILSYGQMPTRRLERTQVPPSPRSDSTAGASR